MHTLLGVDLLPFDLARHLPQLRVWLGHPHVSSWWGDPDEALAAVCRHSPNAQALIAVDARPVGYLCWQNPPPEALQAAGLGDLPSGLVDVDILIGEPDFMGQGVGPQALALLVDRFQAEGVSFVGMGTATANRRALRAYEKAGFHVFRTFSEGGQEMCYLIRSLEAAV